MGFWAMGKRVSCAKTRGLMLMICMSYDVFLRKDLPFGVTMIASVLKFLVVLIFFVAINSLTC